MAKERNWWRQSRGTAMQKFPIADITNKVENDRWESHATRSGPWYMIYDMHNKRQRLSHQCNAKTWKKKNSFTYDIAICFWHHPGSAYRSVNILEGLPNESSQPLLELLRSHCNAWPLTPFFCLDRGKKMFGRGWKENSQQPNSSFSVSTTKMSPGPPWNFPREY